MTSSQKLLGRLLLLSSGFAPMKAQSIIKFWNFEDDSPPVSISKKQETPNAYTYDPTITGKSFRNQTSVELNATSTFELPLPKLNGSQSLTPEAFVKPAPQGSTDAWLIGKGGQESRTRETSSPYAKSILGIVCLPSSAKEGIRW